MKWGRIPWNGVKDWTYYHVAGGIRSQTFKGPTTRWNHLCTVPRVGMAVASSSNIMETLYTAVGC